MSKVENISRILSGVNLSEYSVISQPVLRLNSDSNQYRNLTPKRLYLNNCHCELTSVRVAIHVEKSHKPSHHFIPYVDKN